MPPFYKETEAQKQGWNVNQATRLKSSRGGLKHGASGPAVPALLQGQAHGWASGSYHWRREAVVRGEAGTWGSSPPEFGVFWAPRKGGSSASVPGGGGESRKEWLGSSRRAQLSRRGLPSGSWPWCNRNANRERPQWQNAPVQPVWTVTFDPPKFPGTVSDPPKWANLG